MFGSTTTGFFPAITQTITQPLNGLNAPSFVLQGGAAGLTSELQSERGEVLGGRGCDDAADAAVTCARCERRDQTK